MYTRRRKHVQRSGRCPNTLSSYAADCAEEAKIGKYAREAQSSRFILRMARPTGEGWPMAQNAEPPKRWADLLKPSEEQVRQGIPGFPMVFPLRCRYFSCTLFVTARQPSGPGSGAAWQNQESPLRGGGCGGLSPHVARAQCRGGGPRLAQPPRLTSSCPNTLPQECDMIRSESGGLPPVGNVRDMD